MKTEEKQLDIFGNDCDIPVEPRKGGRGKFTTMQEFYGTLKGFKCGQCNHCLRQNYHGRTYFKCELWFVSNSEATDIRLSNVACRKFENEVKNER